MAHAAAAAPIMAVVTGSGSCCERGPVAVISFCGFTPARPRRGLQPGSVAHAPPLRRGSKGRSGRRGAQGTRAAARALSTYHRAPAESLLHQSKLAWRLRCRPQSVRGRGRGSEHSPPECQGHRRARILTPPPSRTVQQPQACSTSRSFMAAVKSTQLASVSHRAAAARRKLAPPVGACMAAPLQAAISACRCVVVVARTLRPSARGRDEHAP